MRRSAFFPSRRGRCVYAAISLRVVGFFNKLACLLFAICAASSLQWAHADPSDQLYPGLAVVAPAGKERSTIAVEKAQCAGASQGNIAKYATCLEDLQYVLPGSVKAAPMPPQQMAPHTSTPIPPVGPASARQEGAPDSDLYRQVAKVAATGNTAFNAGTMPLQCAIT
jgi:hypothetical protein